MPEDGTGETLSKTLHRGREAQPANADGARMKTIVWTLCKAPKEETGRSSKRLHALRRGREDMRIWGSRQPAEQVNFNR